jgi:hypothetical protein
MPNSWLELDRANLLYNQARSARSYIRLASCRILVLT